MLEGLVSCIKHTASLRDDLYYIISMSDEDLELHECGSDVVLHLGEEIKADLEGGRITSAMIKENPDLKRYTNFAKSRAEKLLVKRKPSDANPLDRLTSRMLPKLESAAGLMLERLLLGTPTVVRFHNDADGSSGAYCLFKALEKLFDSLGFGCRPRVIWKVQRSVVYSTGDASEDTMIINNYESVSKPLLMVIDFGTSQESNAGILLVKEKFDVIWLDHHPIVEDFAGLELSNYINPWLFGGDSSYTAGFLACEFARLLCDIDVSEFQAASLIGDYSSYATKDKKGSELALLLDMLTSDKRVALSSSGQEITPNEIDRILSDPERTAELISYAKSKLAESIDSGLSMVRQYRSESANIYLLDFESVRKEDSATRYPLPGRYASKLLERMELLSDRPCILVLHFGYFISIRMSGSLEGRLDLLKIAKELRASYKEIESAGGHSGAISIRMKSVETKREVLNALLRSFGVKFG